MTATNIYKKWMRPSLVAFTNDEPVPNNAADGSWHIGASPISDYIFLTDDNRSDIQISSDRIEYKKRMINGRMRSYHVVDKKSFSFSWQSVPSDSMYISESGGQENTGWAAGKEMLTWYKDHTGSFYVMLFYDTPDAEGNGIIPVKYRVETYNVFFESFSYNVTTRGSLHDHWDISMSLVEV